jgi:predicted AAA+ superfamily ATPase
MENQNPWWYGEEDKKYEEWKTSEVKWIPPIINSFNFEPFSLNFIVGPRQVGKTTALKIFINQNLLPKVNPKSIFYFSCDELTDFKELGEILDNYIDFRNANKIKSSFIILDEITFVDEWYRAIKARIDRFEFKNDILIITGSSSLEILKQKEYFPGRRGKGKDIIFYPLSFRQYVNCLKNVDTLTWEIDDIEKAMKANKIHEKMLENLFEKYIETGGFPLPIKEFFSSGKISHETRKVYIDWLKTDFIKLGKNESSMKEILSYIINSANTPVSWLNISKETSISSPHTTQSYVEALKGLFVVEILNFLSPEGKVIFKKNKKIHITDPFLYKTICEYVRAEPNVPALLESVVASHLSRIYETFYWKNGSEIDLVIKKGKKQLGVEVKTQVKSWKKPKHITSIVVDKKEIPIFLSSLRI